MATVNCKYIPPELLREIAAYLDIRAIGRFIRTCRDIYNTISPTSHIVTRELARLKRVNNLRYNNPLWALVITYPDNPWAWDILSANPSITIDIVLSYPKKPWRWDILTCHINITYEHITTHVHLPWYMNLLYLNPNIKYDELPMDIFKTKYTHYSNLSENTPIEYIFRNQHICWSWADVCSRPDFKLKYALEYPKLKLFKYLPNKNVRMSIDDLLKYKYETLNWSSATESSNITLDDILRHPELPWEWNRLYLKHNIPIEDIIEHHNASIGWYALRPDICRTSEHVPPIHIDWQNLDERTDITINIIIQHKMAKWNWCALSRHVNITVDNILKTISLPWVWDEVPKNPSFTPDMILTGAQMWNLRTALTYCKFTFADLCYFNNAGIIKDEHWVCLSLNEHLSLYDVLNFPYKPWKWRVISAKYK